MRNDRSRKEFQKKCRDEERNSLKNLELFWKERGKETVQQFSSWTKRWPRDKEGKRVPQALLQERLENSPILVLTANQVEANMMVRLLAQESSGCNSESLATITAEKCRFHFGMIANNHVVHVQPKDMASFTKGGSFPAIESILKRYKPQLVISLGVAFGTDATKQDIGDVLISKRLLQYDSNNKYSEGTIKLNGSPYETNPELMCRWMNLLEYEEFPDETSVLKTKSFHWYCGTMLSGGSVVDEVEQKVKLLEAAKNRGIEDVIGGEMEGSGLYLACDDKKIPCIVIKGICDWGVNKNAWDEVLKDENNPPDNKTVKNSIQALAFANAFSALKCLLEYDSTFISTNGDTANLPDAPITHLWTAKTFERIMMKISTVNILPYILIGTVCLIMSVLFQSILLELFKLEIVQNGLKFAAKIIFFILLGTVFCAAILFVFFKGHPQYRLKPMSKKIISVMVFAEISVLLFTAEIYWEETVPIHRDRGITPSYFLLVYAAFLCTSTIIWAVAKYLRIRPESLISSAANITFKNLSYKKCCCIIKNTSETTLYSVSIGWICKEQLSPVQIHKCGTVPSKSELSVTYHGCELVTHKTPHFWAPDVFLPMIPDMLQVNYRMPNGDLVVHLITTSPKKIDQYDSSRQRDFCASYSERVLLVKNGIYRNVLNRICYSEITDIFNDTE